LVIDFAMFWEWREPRRLPDRARHRFARTVTRSICFSLAQFPTENRFTLFLGLL
jgi:hypothetical protein